MPMSVMRPSNKKNPKNATEHNWENLPHVLENTRLDLSKEPELAVSPSVKIYVPGGCEPRKTAAAHQGFSAGLCAGVGMHGMGKVNTRASAGVHSRVTL